MTIRWPFAGSLLAGSVCSTAPWPYTLYARLGDLRPRFRVKQMLRGGCRAIARDGRVLLCADRSLDDLLGLIAQVRLQTWNRSILPGDTASPYGVLVSLRGVDIQPTLDPLFAAELRRRSEAKGELQLEVGGGMVLDFAALAQN